MSWTDEQKSAIEKKGANILVAAAAGSGKTTVLVERIIQKIINEKVDIDKLLVVTFTNAAALEMRERILEAIYKKIDDNPDDEHLKRQIVLLPKSNISTIHSFCLEVIKNNFFEIDLSSNFRIASEEEVELLKQEVLDDLFEKYYDEENEDFISLVETYAGYRGDDSLKDIVFKIYNYIQSCPYPKKWLNEKVELFNQNNNNEEDFGKTIWGRIILDEFSDRIEDGINSLKIVYNKLQKFFELEKATQMIKNDLEILEDLKSKTKISWDATYEAGVVFDLPKWSDDKKVSSELKDEAKKIRTNIKTKINKTVAEILLYNSEEAFKDIFLMYDSLVKLEKVINDFSDEFSKRKKEKNLIDFGDIEHYALKILVEEKDGQLVPTEVAKRYQNKFEEIAIDEYQDSNRVQEEILSKVSRGNNMYMVGDVKQSIYKFRQACPDLFLEKYDKYSLDGNDAGLKIQLFKNFRSKENVLDVTNEIFETIMSRELGEIEYDQDEYLYFKANYIENPQSLGRTELDIIDLADIEDEEDSIENNANEERVLEKEEIEAKFVANRIKKLMDGKFKVQIKNAGTRDLQYKDIVILLRSPGKIGKIYEKELLEQGIPVYSDSSNEYLDAIEIQTITNVLKILDNPTDDIALVSTLRSPIAGFTDNELVEIRVTDKDCYFYDALNKYVLENKGDLADKINNFLDLISKWRKIAEYTSISDLLSQIYFDTGYYNYVNLMVNGSVRQSNLKILLEKARSYEQTSFKGLYNFIKFIDKMKLGNSDFSSAKVIGENEDVVRIMSIHKSKGLEFPVVFLSSTSKMINFEDLKDAILIDQDLGLGPDYINYSRKIKYSTAAKFAIKLKAKEDSISEEMRVLYVALTRAREKLIITGVSNNYTKQIDKKKEMVSILDKSSSKISPLLIKKNTSYLEWIELVLLYSNKLKDLIDFNVLNKNDVINSDEQNEQRNEEVDIDLSGYNDYKKIEDVFAWKYNYSDSTKLPIKTSVSLIKELSFENNENYDVGLAKVIPAFLEEDERKLTSRERGSLVHLVLQKIDFTKDYSRDELKKFIDDLAFQNIITPKQRENINETKIYNFLQSDLSKEIKTAKEINREKPFCTKIPAKDIYGTEGDEEILVQGIIDLYYIDSNDRIVLVDYKTDYVENDNEHELVDKYKIQLELYKEALEKALNKKVYKTYIYSIYLGKALEL